MKYFDPNDELQFNCNYCGTFLYQREDMFNSKGTNIKNPFRANKHYCQDCSDTVKTERAELKAKIKEWS